MGSLLPFYAEFRIAPMMSHERHANPSWDFPVDDVVGKPFQICSMKPWLGGVEPHWARTSHHDDAAEFRFEFLPEPV